MKVILHNEPNPENNAMLQALYSRSPKSVLDHIERLKKSGSTNFMSQYYIGYGHASIGELGDATLYLEGISMLAAKAIEDFALFAGQECSSRYIDFSQQPFHNPYPEKSRAYGIAQRIFDKLREFYVTTLPLQIEHLRNNTQIQPQVHDEVFEKALRAAAFDVLRGFLPAGATTNVAWKVSLRHADERLRLLMHHPLAEVRDIAFSAYAQLYENYPSSFRKAYYDLCLMNRDLATYEMFKLEGPELAYRQGEFTQFYSPKITDYRLINKEFYDGKQIDSRNAYGTNSPIPVIVRGASTPRHDPKFLVNLDFYMFLDFGSFRDLHRHRNGYCSNPMLTIEHGPHFFYVEDIVKPEQAEILLEGPDGIENLYRQLLDPDFATDCASLVSVGNKDITEVSIEAYAQYVVPMLYRVPVHYRGSLNQIAYIAELRSNQTVHPTLRVEAQRMGTVLRNFGYKVNVDMTPSKFNVKRGKQDIVVKT